MRFNDFTDALYAAGWEAPNDAQHRQIKELWRNLFPVVAELEDELHDAETEAKNRRKRDECIGRYGA